MRTPKWFYLKDAPNATEYVLETWDCVSGGRETDHVLRIIFLRVMDKYLPKVRAELLGVIATRASPQRKEHMEIDKPRIVIPPKIDVGEDDIQLKFQSVGDGMFFELSAKEGDRENSTLWSLFRFVPGKGILFYKHVGFTTTEDFPTDDHGRLQLMDEEMKPLVQVYPEQVVETGEPSKAGRVEFLGREWYLEVGEEGLILRCETDRTRLGVLTITPTGVKRWTGVPERLTGVKAEGDHGKVKMRD